MSLSNPFRIVRDWLRRRKFEAEMADEMRAHLDMQAERNRAAGMSPEEARYTAHRQFGNVASLQERVREQRAGRLGVWLEQFGQDIRYAARSLVRARRFSGAVVLTLALGIGATVALVSVAQRALFPPVPFAETERLAVLSEFNRTQNRDMGFTNLARYASARQRRDIFAKLAAMRAEAFILVVGDQPTTVQAELVSPEFFEVFGIRPELGRTFSLEEHKAGPESGVIVLSHATWRNEFGGNPQVIGRQVVLGGKIRRVIGVMPASFARPPNFAWGHVFLPMAEESLVTKERAGKGLWALGLLALGVTAEQAQSRLSALPAPENCPTEMWKPRVPRVHLLESNYRGDEPLLLGLLLAAAACFYAVACINAVNLMLLRVLSRQHELFVRLALGGGSVRIVRGVLLETMLLAGAGSVAGVGLAYGGCAVLGHAIGSWLPAGVEGLIDRAILAFALGLGLLTTLVTGLTPAWRGSRIDLGTTMKEGAATQSAGPHATRLRGVFVVLQTALAVALLIAGALMLRTFWQLRQRGVGIDTSRKVAILGNRPYEDLTSAQYGRIADRVLEEIQRIPEVAHAALAQGLPLQGFMFELVRFADHPEAGSISSRVDTVSADYFRTLGIPLLAGQGFEEVRANDPRVVIISETLAKKYFSGGNAIGRQLETDSRGKMEIIGVVGDIRERGPRQADSPQFYVPFNQRRETDTMFLIIIVDLRVAQPSGFYAAARKAAYAAEPRLALYLIELDVAADSTVRVERAGFMVLQMLSVLALGLAALGLYAVMAYAVAQRQREFGVRLALGATPRDLARLIFASGLQLAGLGLLIGLVAAWGLTRFLQSMLFETTSHDPLAFSIVALVLAIVAFLACWLPARRAARVDPVVALRAE